MHRNKNDMLASEANERQRFSIRKLTIGASSVLLGTFLVWGGTSVAKADTIDGSAGTEQVASNKDVQTPASSNAGQDSSKANGSETVVPSTSSDSTPLSSENGVKKQSATDNSVSVDHAKSGSEDENEQTVNVNVADLGNGNTTGLLEKKSVSGESSNISADIYDSNNQKQDVSNKTIMADNDNVYVTVKYNNDEELHQGDTFTVKYAEPNSSSNNWVVAGWDTGESNAKTLDGGIFKAINNGDGTFTVTSLKNIDTGYGFTLNLAFKYGNSTNVISSEKTTQLNVALIKGNGNSTITSKDFPVTVTPYTDKVKKDELAHGFAGPTGDVNSGNDGIKNDLTGTSAVGEGIIENTNNTT